VSEDVHLGEQVCARARSSDRWFSQACRREQFQVPGPQFAHGAVVEVFAGEETNGRGEGEAGPCSGPSQGNSSPQSGDLLVAFARSAATAPGC